MNYITKSIIADDCSIISWLVFNLNTNGKYNTNMINIVQELKKIEVI